MKTKTKSKILVFFATVFLLCCAFLCGTLFTKKSAKADTPAAPATPSITIAKKNVSHEAELKLLYAVKGENFDETTYPITMLFWNEPQSEYTVSTATEENKKSADAQKATINSVEYSVFYSNGIAAKEMTDYVYCRAYANVNGVAVYSEVVKYSVLDYIYDITTKSGATAEQTQAATALAAYGGAVQTLLGYNTERLASDTYYAVNVVNGTLSDGFTYGKYNENESFTLVPAQVEGKLFDRWEADKATAQINGNDVSISENTTLTAVYKTPELPMFIDERMDTAKIAGNSTWSINTIDTYIATGDVSSVKVSNLASTGFNYAGMLPASDPGYEYYEWKIYSTVAVDKAFCIGSGVFSLAEGWNTVTLTYEELTKNENDVIWYGTNEHTFYLGSLKGIAQEGADFVVTVEEGRDVKILQLTDTQILDLRYGDDDYENKLFTYIRQAVQTSQPDLILLTGDQIYGYYDEDGSHLTALVALMESFNIPWAPVLGNHDAGTQMGINWVCQQYENAENCLFKRGRVTGYGNYSIAIQQGNKIVKVIYMMDTHGGYDAYEQDLVKTTNGFAEDQITWLNENATAMDTYYGYEISKFLGIHIPIAEYETALQAAGYQSDDSATYTIGVDVVAQNGDFGAKGQGAASFEAEGLWDILKANHFDGVFAGHTHLNNFSVLYDGIRLTNGLKTGMYDEYKLGQLGGTLITLANGGTSFSVNHVYHDWGEVPTFIDEEMNPDAFTVPQNFWLGVTTEAPYVAEGDASSVMLTFVTGGSFYYTALLPESNPGYDYYIWNIYSEYAEDVLVGGLTHKFTYGWNSVRLTYEQLFAEGSERIYFHAGNKLYLGSLKGYMNPELPTFIDEKLDDTKFECPQGASAVVDTTIVDTENGDETSVKITGKDKSISYAALIPASEPAYDYYVWRVYSPQAYAYNSFLFANVNGDGKMALTEGWNTITLTWSELTGATRIYFGNIETLYFGSLKGYNKSDLPTFIDGNFDYSQLTGATSVGVDTTIVDTENGDETSIKVTAKGVSVQYGALIPEAQPAYDYYVWRVYSTQAWTKNDFLFAGLSGFPLTEGWNTITLTWSELTSSTRIYFGNIETLYFGSLKGYNKSDLPTFIDGNFDYSQLTGAASVGVDKTIVDRDNGDTMSVRVTAPGVSVSYSALLPQTAPEYDYYVWRVYSTAAWTPSDFVFGGCSNLYLTEGWNTITLTWEELQNGSIYFGRIDTLYFGGLTGYNNA